MSISPLAGKPAPESILANVPRLVTDYFALEPDPASATERVAFGTSGHRGSSLACSFNEAHIAAITQIRNPGSVGRLFFERKVAEGKTKKEAVRALKRRISDAVYRQLLLDAAR